MLSTIIISTIFVIVALIFNYVITKPRLSMIPKGYELTAGHRSKILHVTIINLPWSHKWLKVPGKTASNLYAMCWVNSVGYLKINNIKYSKAHITKTTKLSWQDRKSGFPSPTKLKLLDCISVPSGKFAILYVLQKELPDGEVKFFPDSTISSSRLVIYISNYANIHKSWPIKVIDSNEFKIEITKTKLKVYIKVLLQKIKDKKKTL